MSAFSLVAWKMLGTLVPLFALSVVALTWIRLFEAISSMRNPVPWLMAGLGARGDWWSSRTGDEEWMSSLHQK